MKVNQLYPYVTETFTQICSSAMTDKNINIHGYPSEQFFMDNLYSTISYQ